MASNIQQKAVASASPHDLLTGSAKKKSSKKIHELFRSGEVVIRVLPGQAPPPQANLTARRASSSFSGGPGPENLVHW